MLPYVTRRRALKALGGGIAVGGLGGTANAECSLSQQLSTVWEATQAYADVEKARDEGYDTMISPYESGMGFHFLNPELTGTNLEKPAVLVYGPTADYDAAPGDRHDRENDDNLALGAVEFAVGGDQSEDPPDVFADENSGLEPKVPEEDGWHYVEEADITALHVWAHRGNPAGIFHDTNPTID